MAVIGGLSVLTACGEMARLPVEAGTRPTAGLPEPSDSLIPTLNIAPAKAWLPGEQPVPAEGLAVTAYASKLDHPRWLYVLPNGDVLVAETNAPAKPDDGKGIKGRVMKSVMKKAGSATPSPNRITLLRDADGNGTPEVRTTFVDGLNSPFGMALVGDDFYVANSDAVIRFAYTTNATKLEGRGSLVVLAAGGPDQSPLDQESHREHRWHEAVRHRRLEQQRRRERP